MKQERLSALRFPQNNHDNLTDRFKQYLIIDTKAIENSYTLITLRKIDCYNFVATNFNLGRDTLNFSDQFS